MLPLPITLSPSNRPAKNRTAGEWSNSPTTTTLTTIQALNHAIKILNPIPTIKTMQHQMSQN